MGAGYDQNRPVSLLDHGVVLVAAFVAGAVNAVAGGGSLLTFPALLAVGFAPVPASVTNTVGLLPGYLGGAHAYRREIRDQRARVRSLLGPAVLGAIVGAGLLLVSPARIFEALVPLLVLFAAALLAAQPRVSAWVEGRRDGEVQGVPAVLLVVTFLGGVYGAYFGGALGVVLLAALGSVLADDLQRINGLKSALSLVINSVAVTIFVFSPHVHWSVAAVMGVGSLAGGRLGAGVARRLGARQLRYTVVTFATAVGLVLLVRG
jgi:uncharacterized membrane protein YfcA